MKTIFTAGLFTAASALAVSAQEAPVCMNAAELEASLVEWYNETPATQESPTRYVWASGIGGTWTIVEYNDSTEPGRACVIAQGENWQPGMDDDTLLALSEVPETRTY